MRFAAASLLLLPALAGAADLYDEVNRLRAGEGRCKSAVKLAPLKPVAALDDAAQALARGSTLERSIAASGYRATRSGYFSISGDGVAERAAQLIAERGNCNSIMDPAFTDVGIYVDAREIRVVAAAPFAPAVRMSEDAAGHRVLELVNRARASARTCGDRRFNAAKPLRWNDTLARAALQHAEDMARNNYFSHDGRDGSTPAQRVTRAGYAYRATGENIAAGQMDPETVVAGWIKSPGHCANLMNGRFTEMGVAYAVDKRSESGVYWAQEFGAPR